MTSTALREELYARLRADANIFHFIQTTGLDGLAYWDLTTREGWFSEEVYKLIGYTAASAAAAGLTTADFTFPEDLEPRRQSIAEAQGRGEQLFDELVRFRHRDGRVIYVRAQGLFLKDDRGETTRMLNVLRNETVARENQLLLDQIHDVARIGTWAYDLEQNSLHWSAMTKEIHEVPADYQPEVSTALKYYREGDSRNAITKLFERAVATGEHFDTELQLVTAKGRHVWVRAIGQPVMVNGEYRRLEGIFQDIDERKRSSERQVALAILRSKAKEMEQFSYAASHQLREPLLTVAGYVEVIQEDHGKELPEEVGVYLNTIREAIDHMDGMLRGLLDYSKLSQIKEREAVDLNEVVRQVSQDLAEVIAQTGTVIQAARLPIISGYPQELKLLFNHLIGNAIKYRRPLVQAVIEISCNETEGGTELFVKDNGIGIPENQLENVFHLFRQLHERGLYVGSGTGLANVQKIVEMHGGTIAATSELGQGTTFTFNIPR